GLRHGSGDGRDGLRLRRARLGNRDPLHRSGQHRIATRGHAPGLAQPGSRPPAGTLRRLPDRHLGPDHPPMATAAPRGDGMRLSLRMAVVVAAMLLPAVASAGYILAPEPTWIRVDQAPDPGSVPPGADDTRYLLVVDQVDLTGPRPAWHRRVSYVVGAERGLAGAGRFSINYQPDYQSVALHAVQVWRDGVVHERRDAVQVQELRREDDLESGILDGLHTLDVTIPDLKVGDRIDYSYSIEGTNPVFGDAWYDYYTATYSDPVGLR